MNAQETSEFIENSRHALNHLFNAIDEYNKILVSTQQGIEDIEASRQALADLFMYRDQWSPNANHHYIQYMQRIEQLEEKQKEAQSDPATRIEKALGSIGATVESMSSLAGAVLQIAKQVLSLRHAGKPELPAARDIGSQKIFEVIWEGRNHAMHWDEGKPKQKVQNMLDALSKDLGIDIEVGRNNCLSILGALNWRSTEAVVRDLHTLINPPLKRAPANRGRAKSRMDRLDN